MSLKRILAGILSASLVLTVALSGCNNGQSGSADPSSSTGEGSSAASAAESEDTGDKPEKLQAIVDNDTVGIIQPAADILERDEGIKTEFIVQSYDQSYTKIMTSIMGGTPIDVIICDSVWTAEFTEAGMITPVDDYISAELKEDLFPGFVDQCSYEGKLMALPMCAQTKWLYYNTDLLEQAGYSEPPKTWDELFEMGQNMVSKGLCKYPIAWAAKQAEGMVCDWFVCLTASGGSMRDDNGNWVFNNENGVAGLKLMVDSIQNGNADPGSINYTDREVLNPFMAGDIPFVLNWAFAYALANDPAESTIAGNVGIGLVPSNSDGVVSSSVTGGGGFAIASTSEHPDYAWKLIENVVSREALFQSAELASNAPPIKSMYEDEEFIEQFPTMAAAYPQFEYAQPRPALSKYSEWSNNMQVSLHEAVTGSKSVEDALNEMIEKSAAYQ